MIINKTQLIAIIKEEYSKTLIKEAQSPQGIASAVANYLRIKYPHLGSMEKREALVLVDTAVQDMMNVKQIPDPEMKKTIMLLTVRDLMSTKDLVLNRQVAQDVVGKKQTPQQTPQGQPLGRLSLKRIFMPKH